jgi:ABC-type polar amino acid transport system ATPase subunit
MSAQPQLVAEGVHKAFGKNAVLRGIDLEVAEHEVVCLIGASGSGKSTLLRCINLLEPIDSSSASAWPTKCTSTRTGSPAGSSSGSRSYGRWRCGPG